MKNAIRRRIVAKVGSNVITGTDGTLDTERMEAVAGDIAGLMKSGNEIILVSSGAVAAGRSMVKPDRRLDSVSSRQLFSAVGQVRLINAYFDIFERHGILCGQVLTTKESLSTRTQYLNQMHCMNTMLQNGVLPVINENDTISVSELMFTDNDELSGMIATMTGADTLVILSNVDGIFDGPPDSADSHLIREIFPGDKVERYISGGKSSFGRGGMLTKHRIASKVAGEGVDVFIANGRREHILRDISENPETAICTRFIPGTRSPSRVKKWIAHSDCFAKGEIHINSGAMEALFGEKASSLLPVGVSRISGEFEKNDIVRIISPEGLQIGVGKVSQNSDKARETAGKHGGRPLIHYDYLCLEGK